MSVWLLLFFVVPVLSVDYPSIYIPIGAGLSQNGRNFSDSFGGYGNLFNYCGKYTTDQFNEQFPIKKVPTSHDYVVQCSPSPTRVIVSVEGNFDFGKFPRDLKKECELLTCSAIDYEADGTDLGAITNGLNDSKALAPKPENPDYNVCMAKKAAYSAGATGATLFANEDNCRVAHSGLDTAVSVMNKFVQLPRWLKKGDERANVRNFMYDQEKVLHEDRVPFGGVIKVDSKAGFKPCHTTCDRGQVVKLNMNSGSYKMMIYLKPSCSHFQICLNPAGFDTDLTIPTCVVDRRVDVVVEGGLVMFYNKGRASLIELKSPYHEDAHPVAIEFGYGFAHPTKPGETLSEFYIANDHREFVTSETEGFKQHDASKVAIFFPDPQCLIKTAGIFSKNIEMGTTWSAENVDLVGSLYNENGTSITGPQNQIPFQTTTEEPRLPIPKTTTLAPVTVVPMALTEVLDTNNKSAASFVAGKWWTWGVYIGFLIGTLVTLALGGAIMYFMRRTFFGIWYRAMYKRYGCDVSGTTGGITGVGYGNTVTGTETVGGITGATTGGMTGGTTGGGTTGGATSSTSRDATETTSMLSTNNSLAM